MRKLSNYLYPLSLLFLALITHRQWFNPFSVLNFSDWVYWPNAATNQLYNSYGTWINFFNFGSSNIQLTFNLFTSIWSLLSNLGLSYDFATKVTFLIPIAVLGFISPFILFKKLTANEFASFAVAVFYGSTTHFLVRQTSHLPIAFVYALSPLIIYLHIKDLECNKSINWLLFFFVYSISICYEIRITYILTFVLLGYFLFFYIKDFRKYFKNILFCIFFVLLLNFFWLLPTLFGGAAANIAAVADRGLFGNDSFDIKNALNLSEASWTGGIPNFQFIKEQILWYFWFVPITIFSGFLFKNNKHKKKIIFFAIISLIGIFLTKQSDAPLPSAYLWLYDNFPGFNLFREASKFYLLTAIGYGGLIVFGLVNLSDCKNKIFSKYLFYFFGVLIIILSLLNLRPLITGEMRTMFVPRHIPGDYVTLEDFILKQPEYFRTFWTPVYSRWSIYTNIKPELSNADIIQSDWQGYSSYGKVGLDSSVSNQITDIYNKTFSNRLFDVSSIKYVVVPLQDKLNDDDLFVYYGGQADPNIRKLYINELDNISWLKKINIGSDNLVVYENKNYRDHIYLTEEPESIYKNVAAKNVVYQFKNPTEYKISLKNIKTNTYLNFSEKYVADWSLRIGGFNWLNVLTNKAYFLDDKYHLKNDAGLNSFLIDPDYIKANFYKSDYKQNSDGSIDVELTLYFKPQSYFYLGLLISGTTLLACLGYLAYAYAFAKRRKVKRKTKKAPPPPNP